MIVSKLKFQRILASVVFGLVSTSASSHGLVEDPPARNWYCGATTKPDQVFYGDPEYPQCRDAFAADPDGGYQFMSVLTHDRGRAVVSPLPEHVCGFGSETWGGGATPWDQTASSSGVTLKKMLFVCKSMMIRSLQRILRSLP